MLLDVEPLVNGPVVWMVTILKPIAKLMCTNVLLDFGLGVYCMSELTLKACTTACKKVPTRKSSEVPAIHCVYFLDCLFSVSNKGSFPLWLICYGYGFDLGLFFTLGLLLSWLWSWLISNVANLTDLWMTPDLFTSLQNMYYGNTGSYHNFAPGSTTSQNKWLPLSHLPNICNGQTRTLESQFLSTEI